MMKIHKTIVLEEHSEVEFLKCVACLVAMEIFDLEVCVIHSEDLFFKYTFKTTPLF